MKRLYFISEDLDDLAVVESQMQKEGLTEAQLHVLSENDGGVDQRRLHNVNSLMKRDVLHSWLVGAVVGSAAAILLLVLAYFTGLTASAVGWTPFVFLAVVVMGFCVWEGGLLGLGKPNVHFQRFQQALKQGQHVFFVEVSAQQEMAAQRVLRRHPKLQAVGSGDASPDWLIRWQNKWRHFVDVMP
jgi:hypothetical protein